VPAKRLNAAKVLKLTDGQFESSKIKVKSAKLRNPDFVGMTILIVFLFCIIAYFSNDLC
jgi:hypothetical protein